MGRAEVLGAERHQVGAPLRPGPQPLHRVDLGGSVDAALREAQGTKDAVRAYELVYAALGGR